MAYAYAVRFAESVSRCQPYTSPPPRRRCLRVCYHHVADVHAVGAICRNGPSTDHGGCGDSQPASKVPGRHTRALPRPRQQVLAEGPTDQALLSRDHRCTQRNPHRPAEQPHRKLLTACPTRHPDLNSRPHTMNVGSDGVCDQHVPRSGSEIQVQGSCTISATVCMLLWGRAQLQPLKVEF